MTVLVVTNQLDATADYLCAKMAEASVRFVRLNTDRVAESCSFRFEPGCREISVDGTRLIPEDVSVLWYRRPEAIEVRTSYADRHERAFAAAEWTAALEGFLGQIAISRWINHPSRIFGAFSKLEQLRRAAAHGLMVPAWLCTTSTAEARAFYAAHSGGVVAKPLFSGYVERANASEDTVVYTTEIDFQTLQGQHAHLGAPTLFQRLVRAPDVRITVIDDRLHAVRIASPDGSVDVRRDNMRTVTYSDVELPEVVRQALLAVVRSYGLRFAAIDMLESSDGWYFLEINPNGQWAWLDLVAQSSIYKAFLAAFAA